MKNICLLFLLIIVSCKETVDHSLTEPTTSEIPSNEQINDFAIVIHGGAGTIKKENMTPELERQYNDKLTESIQAGHAILKNGGSAMDAVEASIRIMEDSPLFNSGKGAVFTHDGINSLDASFMDGETLNAGAVAGTTRVKNPISLARKIMTDSEHVLLSGAGADEFAVRLNDPNIEIVENSYFYTENRFQSLQRVLDREKNKNQKQVYSQDTDYNDLTNAQLEHMDPFIKESKNFHY